MPQQLISQALDAWREGERLLETLPQISPDHESVAVAVAQLRDAYQSLTTESDDAAKLRSSSRAVIERATRAIAEARDRTS